MSTAPADVSRRSLADSRLAADAPLLSVENVEVRFQRFSAVRGVSFRLRGGDFLGLLGENGAGKTTLMRAVCGLQAIRRGDVRIMGEVLTDDTQHLLRQIGFTPDTPPLYDGMTVRNFLRFIGRLYELTAADTDERIDFWLDKLWLTQKADARIKGLSRGMRQRIGIARTLLPNPALVVLDEPAAGLDPAGRAQFRDLLADLRNQGKALIVSSHVLSDLADHCTHIGLMAGGRMTRFEPIASFAGGVTADRCRYRARLTGPVADIGSRLAGLDAVGVEDIELRGDDLLLLAGRDPTDAAVLLAELVRRGLPVAAFGQVGLNLEEAYLRASHSQASKN